MMIYKRFICLVFGCLVLVACRTPFAGSGPLIISVDEPKEVTARFWPADRAEVRVQYVNQTKYDVPINIRFEGSEHSSELLVSRILIRYIPVPLSFRWRYQIEVDVDAIGGNVYTGQGTFVVDAILEVSILTPVGQSAFYDALISALRDVGSKAEHPL
jgi:hypothetical protein